jgi:hypothetical protein
VILFGKSDASRALGAAIGILVVAAGGYFALQLAVDHSGRQLSGSPAERQAEIEAARQRWRASAPSSYSFEYRLDCFCANAMVWWKVVVQDDKVVGSSIVDASAGRRRIDNNPPRPHPTIDGIFESLAKMQASEPHILSVEFDKAAHFPRRIFVDPIANGVDDEWAIDIRRFAPAGDSAIETAKAEEKQRVQDERQKPSPSQLMQIASNLERAGKTDEIRNAYVTAARSGNCQAAERLGDIYGQGLVGVRRDEAESLKWYNAARVLGCDVPLEKLRR